MKLRRACLADESTNLSVLIRGWLSFGQVLFRSVKSTHIVHAPLNFLTSLTLVNHFEYGHSSVKPCLSNCLTSVAAVAFRSGPLCLNFCLMAWTLVWSIICGTWCWGQVWASPRYHKQRRPCIWWVPEWFFLLLGGLMVFLLSLSDRALCPWQLLHRLRLAKGVRIV